MAPPTSDYHLHPDYSYDGQGSLEDYCRQALAAGVQEMCFTPHYDSLPQRAEIEGYVVVEGQRVPVRSDWPRHFLAAVARAQDAFPTLKLKAGLEVGYFPELEGELGEMLARYPFDFILGSVHCLEGLCLAHPEEARAYYVSHSLADVCARYFEMVTRAAASQLFDAIGHLDLYRRYGLAYYGSEVLTAHRGLAEPALEEMARRGVGLEVNAAGYRHGQDQPYPAPVLLALARQQGIATLTLSSDAHRPSQLGQGLDRAQARAQEAGFTTIYTFTLRQPTAWALS